MALKKKLLTYEEQLKAYNVELNKLRLQLLNSEKLSTTPIYDFKKNMRDVDLQQSISRYKWTGLPETMPESFIERLLYYRGSACLYFENNQLVCLPYAIEGQLNIYGYPTAVEPVAINGNKIGKKALNVFPSGDPNKKGKAVIIYDRAPEVLSGLTSPMAVLKDDLFELLSNIVVKGNINLTNSTKKLMYEVENETQAKEMRKAINTSLNSDDPFIIGIKDTATSNNGVLNSNVENETDKIMQYFSSINNLRCYLSGIKNNGTFEKMERQVVGELTGNEYQTNLILESGLQFRKRAIEDLKKIYPEYLDILNKITVEINVDPYQSYGGVDDANYNSYNVSTGGVENDK